jgi:hypothetical protein
VTSTVSNHPRAHGSKVAADPKHHLITNGGSRLTILPVTPDLWPALEDLFGKSGENRLTVVYAPPGTNKGNSKSSVEYAAGSTTGTTTTASRSFKASKFAFI